MDFKDIELQICPHCGGDGILEDENGWCCCGTRMYCGSHTAQLYYRPPDERLYAYKCSSTLWNIGKVVSSHPGE